jgi:hypothetical protein
MFALSAAMLASTVAAGARTPPPTATPPQISRVLACRAVLAVADRLACFDRETAALGVAVERKDVVVFDRDSVTRTRRSLFGFSVPDLGIFGSNDTDEVKQIDGILLSSASNRDGGYVFSLKDGSHWTQIDDRPFALEPRNGDKVTVKRGVLGSFILSVGGQRGVKVRRIS